MGRSLHLFEIKDLELAEQEEGLNGIDSGWRPWQRLLLAALGGLLLFGAFAPLDLSFIGWIGLVPLYLCGHRRMNRGLFWYGFVFGVVHYTASFAFLSEIFFFCPLLTSFIFAPIPGFWLLLVKRFEHKLLFGQNQALLKDYPGNY